MNDKELRKLKRAELIDIIYKLKTENEALEAEVEDLNLKLEDRDFKLSKVGSIAEATVVLSDIFKEAQKLADDYVTNVRYAVDKRIEKNAKMRKRRN